LDTSEHELVEPQETVRREQAEREKEQAKEEKQEADWKENPQGIKVEY